MAKFISSNHWKYIKKIKDSQKEIESLLKENQKLRQLAFVDSLTGLYSRRYFEDQLKKDIARLDQAQKSRERRKNSFEVKNLSVLFCDVNNFKKVNDTLGHTFGG